MLVNVLSPLSGKVAVSTSVIKCRPDIASCRAVYPTYTSRPNSILLAGLGQSYPAANEQSRAFNIIIYKNLQDAAPLILHWLLCYLHGLISNTHGLLFSAATPEKP